MWFGQEIQELLWKERLSRSGAHRTPYKQNYAFNELVDESRYKKRIKVSILKECGHFKCTDIPFFYCGEFAIIKNYA